MAKTTRKTKQQQTHTAPAATRAPIHLKKEELQKVDELRVNIASRKGQHTPDVQSTLDLMYLRVLGQVKNRTAMETELKALKKTLDQAATQISEILGKTAGSSTTG
jgi:hypothetical protein